MNDLDVGIAKVSLEKMTNLVGSTVCAEFSVIGVIDSLRPFRLSFITKGFNESVSERNRTVISYVDFVLRGCTVIDVNNIDIGYQFLFQGDDRPVDVPSIAWQSKKSFHSVSLVPDFYYVLAGGYRNFLPDEVPSWDSRKSSVLWRGSTTGGFGMNTETMKDLLRYKLCLIGSTLGPKCDFGFVNVVQIGSESDSKAVTEMLKASGLFKERVPLEEYSRFKYFVQAPGNGNSWELIRKLRLGSCMLLVDTDWTLWHDKLLEPWNHFVPVAANLSDLHEKIEWCFANDGEASEIGIRGRRLALAVDFDAEIHETSKIILSRTSNSTFG